MQSEDGDSLGPIGHCIEIAWLRYINLKRILTFPRLPRGVRNERLLYGHESWKLKTHVERKMSNKVSKMLSRITGRSIAEEARTQSPKIVMNLRDRRWNLLGHILRTEEDRLVRKVVLRCVISEKES